MSAAPPAIDFVSPTPEALKKQPFLYYFRKHKRTFVVGLACLLATNILDALPPLLIGMAIDQISGNEGFENVGKTLGLLILVTVFLSIFRYMWRIFWGRFHHSAAADLRIRIFNRYTDLGPDFYSTNSVGQLMSLINNDVNSFRMAIGPGILILMDALFILCIVPPLMMSISVSWTWKTLILIPLIPIITKKLMNAIRLSYKNQQDKFGEMSGVSQEIVAGIRVIKSYAQELNQTRLFNNYNKRYEEACNQVAKVDSLWSPIMELGVTTGSVILLFVGAPEVMSGAISVGSFFAFYQYIQRMIWPMTAIGLGANFIQKGRASFDRIVDLLEKEHNVPDTGTLSVSQFDTLEVNGLTFTYPNEETPTLKNISFTLNKGQTLGLVGPIGSGKSTIIELLCRQYPVESGKILLNGVSIENFKKSDLMNLFSVVPQDAFLFSRKVSENIALGLDNWEMEDVYHITEAVNMDKEIREIPGGYEAYLGEKGVNLSGGQKQRLTLARALIRKSEVVILDDSLSAVDAGTEKQILTQLKNQLTHDGQQHQTTAIIISHRLASLRWANKILVLKNGAVEAFDHHDNLLNNSPTYKNLFHMQTEV